MVVAQVEMPKPCEKVEIWDGPRERVALKDQPSQTCQILDCGWNIPCEGIEGKIKKFELRRERGNISREVVVLKVYITEGWERENVRGK